MAGAAFVPCAGVGRSAWTGAGSARGALCGRRVCAPARAARVARVTRNTARMSAVSPGLARALTGALGVIMAGGGVGAYFSTKSTMSAGAGLVSGALLAYAYASENVPLALGTAAALAIVFAVRFAKTGKIMPSGALCIVSLLFTAAFAAAVFT